jgi:hypothetical protein
MRTRHKSSKHQKLLYLNQKIRQKLRLFRDFNTGDKELGKTERSRQLREIKVNTLIITQFNGNWKQFGWC